MGSAEDATLVVRSQGGDAEAFGELVARHTRAMRAVARAYFACEPDVQDAVQDAFVRAFRAIGQLASPKRFSGWMLRITVNTCMDVLRSQRNRLSLADFSSSVVLLPRVGQPDATPATLASNAERSELLKAAVGRLTEDLRVAVMLRYGTGMSYRDMAAYLDVPETTVVGRLHRAKRALREILEPLGVGVPD